jgi:hypothetical protein
MRTALIFGLASLFSWAAPPRTLRVDYYHTAGPAEVFAVDRVVLEPLPWPGASHLALDATNLGQYFFEVLDRSTNKVLFSRGFASICGEWETTDEAKKRARTFQESLRFPAPEAPVQVVLKKRDAHNAFREIWSFLLDPKDTFIQSAPTRKPAKLIEIQKYGESSDKVDFLILGDGYTEKELPKFEKDARRMAEALFQQSPFKEHRADFNVWALCPPAEASGISRPSSGVQRRSPLGCSYDAFGSERYILTFDNKAWRDVACWAPYEFVEILVNGDTYGGGGIFGLYGTVAADNVYAPYVFVHEFGHHIAGLADEYYTSDVAYETGKDRLEPWELNVSANPKQTKWAALLSPGIPLPTPWKKKAFEDYSQTLKAKRRQIRAENRPEAEMEALFKAEEAFETRLLGTDLHSGKVGAFEGANYEATGYFRSQEDCIMFTRDQVPFCAACQAAIKRVIGLYTTGK